MDVELAALRSLTRILPPIRGAGRVVNLGARLYSRKPRPTVLAQVFSCTMLLAPNEGVDQRLLLAPQLYDPLELRFLRTQLTRGDTFIDIGANIGFYSLMMSSVVQDAGLVLAVEADPDACSRLVQNVELNGLGNVRACNVGIADSNTTLDFGLNLSGNRGASSFLDPGDHRIPVHCVTLHELLVRFDIQRVGAMKLDIEGFEFRVLRKFFAEARRDLWPRALVVEYHTDSSWIRHASGDVIELLSEAGYRLLPAPGTWRARPFNRMLVLP